MEESTIKLISIIIGIFGALKIIYEIIYARLTERRKRKQDYDEVYSEITKLFIEYISYKKTFNKKVDHKYDDEGLAPIINYVNFFTPSLTRFESYIQAQSKLSPRIIIECYALIDTLRRIKTTETIIAEMHRESTKTIQLKRAYLQSLEPIIKNQFKTLIKQLHPLTSVKKKFNDKLLVLDDMDQHEYMKKLDQKVISNFFQSLKDQGVSPEEVGITNHNKVIHAR